MQKSIASILCVLSFVAFAAPTVSYQTATNIAKKVIDQTLGDALDDKRDKCDLAVYSVTRTENTDWRVEVSGELADVFISDIGGVDKLDMPYHDEYYWHYGPLDIGGWHCDLPEQAISELNPISNTNLLTIYMKGGDEVGVRFTRPRYMDETLGPAKQDQKLAAVATDDAAKPADGSLMKYDAAKDRFVKATAGTDYATKTELASAVSTNNPAFVSAVQNTPAPEPGQGEDPPWGTWGTVGAAIAGLVAGLKWLKDKVFDSAGNIQDQFATDLLGKQVAKEAIIYKANTATGLKDRAFNALSLDGTEYNLSTALAAVTPTVENQPRDLLIVATATASTTISFTAGTIKGDKPTIDGAGTWLITLTEYAANTWYCRQIKMEDAA